MPFFYMFLVTKAMNRAMVGNFWARKVPKAFTVHFKTFWGCQGSPKTVWSSC
jgi:hypothetical protein